MQQRSTPGYLAVGVVLIAIGVVFLVGGRLDDVIGWQVAPIAVGVAFFIVGLLVRGEGGSGFAAVGGIVTMVGVVLTFQERTDSYASWAYAWALVAPGGVGLGLTLYGLLTGQWKIARGGFGALVVGIAMFLVLFLFFEGVIGLTPTIDDRVVNVVVPLAIVILGVLIIAAAIVGRLLPGGEEAPGWGPGPGPTPAASPAASPAATDAPRSIALGDATEGDVAVSFGAGVLSIAGVATADRLLEGTFGGGVVRQDRGPGRVSLSTPTDRLFSLPWNNPPFDWRIALTDQVTLRLSIETGAAKTRADLSGLRVTDLRVRTGAAETWITVPAAAGETRIDAQGGAAALHFRVPPGVAARIRSQMALGTVSVDESRFPRDKAGGWISPDYDAATNRVDLLLQGGLGSISVG